MKSTTTYNTAKKQEKNKSPFRFRSDRLIFIICILFASLFWLLIKLSDVYSVNYSFRVTYNNVPSALRLTKMVDSTLDPRVQRNLVIHEVLEAYFPSLDHSKIEDITDMLSSALDDL